MPLQTVETFADVPEGYCVMSIPDDTGDTRKIWNPNDVTDVQMAQEEFERATRTHKMTAFRVNPQTGEQGEIMRDFDPNAGKVIYVKQLQGG